MPPTKIELRGGVVAITGAARGIGRATADLFLERGARVCLADALLNNAGVMPTGRFLDY